MGIVDKTLNLFGLEFTKIDKAENPSAKIGQGLNDDGSTVVSPSVSGTYYGVFMDTEGAMRNEMQTLQQYRTMALYSDVDLAIQDIINEAIPHEDDKPQINVVLDELDFSDSLREKIETEFKVVLSKLKYNSLCSDIFRRWYVDGRLFYQIIVDKDNPKTGIIELCPMEATKIRKIKEIKKERSPSGVDVVTNVEDYYVYSEAGFAANSPAVASASSTSAIQGIKISPDSIIYAPSGFMDPTGQSVLSYLHKAIRPANQLRMMEDSLVVYRIARAPERRIFYVDVGNLPKGKAEQYLKEIMDKYRNKMVYDATTGSVRDDKKYMSMLEDFWMPRRDNSKGTEIEVLPGASNLNQIDDVTYFQTKLFQSLNVPASRLQPDSGFSLGNTDDITRDELKFQKFIDKLRRKFSVLFYEALKTQLILKGICNDVEWEDISDKIHFSFQKDNYFAELKELDVINQRLTALTAANQYVGIYLSKEWINKNILQLSEADAATMQEQMDAEASDQTATIWGQMELQAPPMPPMDPGMMGGSPGPSGDPNDGMGTPMPNPQDGSNVGPPGGQPPAAPDDEEPAYPYKK
jgi:hypothetical protein